MSGRRRSELSPNLFPFLAVLICTLGTLILLLALVAQNAGKAAAAAAESKPSSPDLAAQQAKAAELAQAYQELEQRIREAKWQRDQVVKMREAQTSELDERRIKQTYLEDQIQKLTERLKQLDAEMRMAKDRNAIVQHTLVDLDSLKAKIDQERLKVEELKSQKDNPAPKIVIVPHKGPNGTDRRAIYVECGIIVSFDAREDPGRHSTRRRCDRLKVPQSRYPRPQSFGFCASDHSQLCHEAVWRCGCPLPIDRGSPRWHRGLCRSPLRACVVGMINMVTNWYPPM